MNLKIIIIYDYDNLFNILEEISDYLNLEVIKADHENINKLKSKIVSDFLIISKKKNDLENYLMIDIVPIKISKLLQIINLKFLKNKFNSQSDINIGSYNLNLNSRKISKNNIKLDLTEREANLIVFLKQSPTPVKIDQLQKEVWEHGHKLETHTVETHIYRLRKKIKDKFDDEEFIVSFKNGYKIV